MLDLNRIPEAIRHEGGVSRRLFLAYCASLAALPVIGSRVLGQSTTRPSFSEDPFSLGVASGDPDHHSVVLWTRLAPKPLDPDGGMKPSPVDVQWEIAEDEGMKKVVQKGTAVATPQLGHSVHIEPQGLKPDRWYWYRFRTGDAQSPIGRTRTMPDPTSMPGELKFAFASCQHYEAGLFTAYDQMAKDELDLIVHLGDYIYEGPGGKGNRVRYHNSKEIETLEEYRARHALYRSDSLLMAAHAKCPWLVTWDDHEFDNNCASDISEKKDVTPADFLIRRAAAYQAYYEAMPLRKQCIPNGPDMKLYRKASFGRLAEMMVLDTRQYRTDQPNGDKRSEINEAAMNPEATLMGKEQRQWVESSLAASPATWNILAQQVMMGMVDLVPGEEKKYSMDQWPGYTHERMDFVKFMAERRVQNPVVLTGDIHANWVNDLRVDDRKTELPIVATEFVGTSISSGGNGVDKPANHDAIMSENPCLRFHNRERGYVRCTVTPGNWKSDYISVLDVTKPGGEIVKRASFVVEAGQPGAKKA